ncbi:DUF4376 domain-containing protein [Denitrobaculum tricleocarpae]|uniref:DUF4376 domain-containing protein n=1 Tax=Denitrobaculum tricleocarpae TaxID=2591009 RepID=A0A545TU75_9PROT|nr:DUF4376 domain-containing protein [Denitrobaculum tricleocarpae]TQV80768.1 DUF4376 domain-containing protein [Denitrobaculum tricleocarpae]
MLLTIHDGRIDIDGVKLTVSELAILRPALTLPSEYTTIRYDGVRHERSDGRNQTAGPVPWEPGDSLLTGLTGLIPEIEALRAPAVTLESAKTAKRLAINAQRDNRIFAGLSYLFPDSLTGRVDTREQSDFDNLQALTMLAQVLQAGGETADVITFVDAEDQAHSLTPIQMIELGIAVTQRVAAIYAASWPMKSDVKAAATIAQVEAIDISSGWP